MKPKSYTVVVALVLLGSCSTDNEASSVQSQDRARQLALNDAAQDSGLDAEGVDPLSTPPLNEPDACVDNDGDGYFTCESALPADCDDTYALTFPGADELCDGDDNNCDGRIDEVFEDCDVAPGSRTLPRRPSEVSEVPPECTDNDHDGALHCPDRPDLHRDCDDTWPDNYFGAYEQCDGEDNDCDGLVDEDRYNCDAPPGSSRPDYPHPPREDRRPAPDCRDDDNDQHWYCELSTEYSTDCDPRRGDVFPGAFDLPCDGVDQDCNGIVDDWGTECE